MFLWLYHISPSLHDPCNLAFLKKQSPLPGITDWLWQESSTPVTLARNSGQASCRGPWVGCLSEVHGQSLMSESTDRLSLSFCRERTFRLKGFSQRCLCFVDRNDRRKVKLFYLPFEMSLFLISVLHQADETSCLDSRVPQKETFIHGQLLNWCFHGTVRLGHPSAIFLMLIFFIIWAFIDVLKPLMTNQSHEYVILYFLLKIHSFSSYIQVQDSF